VKWIRNQASHGFLAWAEDLRGGQSLCRWNAYKLLINFNITHSITLLTDGCTNFRKFLVEGTKPNLRKIKEYVDCSLKLGFVTEDGFDRVIDPVKMVHPYVP